MLERTEDLKIANENLKEMENSRSQLLANIAHELGNPIALINNYLQSIQKGLIDIDDKHYKLLVKDKINMLDRLIEDLYDLSTVESREVNFDFKDLRVDRWLNNLINHCQLTIQQEERQFKYESEPNRLDNFKIKVDIERKDQVFLNLISNAVKNTPKEQGTIELFSKLLSKDKLLIQVTDNGKGISEENLPHIFERFFKDQQTNNQGIGLGLGLAIVKQIIQSHRREISVESTVGQGTTFNIYLPIKQIIQD